MSEIADSILDAVEILVDKKTSDLQFNKTIRGKISEIIDESIGKYKIQYQNSYFTAYSSDSNATYQKGSEVYVEILSNDFEKNALILGTVRRLGSNYISIIEKLDKYTNIGAEEDYDGSIAFCSYGGAQEIELYNSENNENLWKINTENIKQAAAASDSLKLGAKIKNQLDAAQRSKQGNFGIKILAEYYNEAELDSLDERSILIREYLFDVNDMTGQPYKYTTATNQYTIFNIDAKNFVKIKSITAFCKDFIQDSSVENPDIWIDDVNLQFLHSLTQEQLQTTSLSIETPYGNYFSTENPNDKILKADLRVKGKKVNYNAQQVDFYWFRRNVRVNSTHEAFSAYGGNGWELLNKTSLNAYKYTLKKDLCTAVQTEFKCVAVFSDNGQVISLNSTIIINNFISELKLYIDSSTGTNFAFNIGKTTLTLQGYEGTDNTRYYWTESIDGGVSVFVDGNELITNNYIDVTIATPAASLLKYECSVYEADNFIGTAAITLVNNKENLGYTLVINNGIQIFKYNSYGVSPASESFALADRMILPALSFTIYDKLGQPIDIKDEDKTKYMNIKWIWPTGFDWPIDDLEHTPRVWKDTMLTIDKTLLKTVTISDIANGVSTQKYAICNQPTLIYGIQNNYNAALANTTETNNNIRLEVEYQGEYLNASTNFTFTKEGELGTNGTQYTARIEPQDDYKEIFICGDSLYAAQYINKAESIDKVVLNNLGSNGVPISSLFKVHLWNGEEDVINDSTVTWELANSTKRAGKPRLTISENNVIINQDGELYSNILQATIAYDDLKFYATYPIIYTNQLNDGKLLYIDKGYREVMYESDGTRGKFRGLPFEPKWLSSTGFTNLGTINESDWSSSWNAAAALIKDSFNKFTIEPPSYYIAEENGNFIQLTVNGITTYLPIELYLNRYGMSAMNDWDGNSIQISEDGGYILSPQVGAGRKENDNSFTGITIGEVFQDQNNKEIGMFGYYQGQRSLFLDAETGSAEFGIEGRGRIKIDTQNNEGVIDSGDYNTTDKTGLKIKFTSTGDGDKKGPYIRYGSGNFTVNADGNLVAKGGGTIAGWKISDSALTSSDNKSTLYSNNGPEEALISGDNTSAYSGRKWSDTRKLRFNINDRFKVDEDGAMKSTSGLIGGWKIGTNTLSAKNDKLILNDTGSLYGPTASYNFTPNKRVWEITNSGVAYFTDVKIKNANAAAHGSDTYSGNNFTWYGKTTSGGTTTYPKIFELTDTGSNIGGWNISGNELSSGIVHINSANAGTSNSVISVGNALKIYGNGGISSSGGGGISCSGGFSSSGSIDISGNGSIGGITMSGGVLQIPLGGLYYGGKQVSVSNATFVTSASLKLTRKGTKLNATSMMTDVDVSYGAGNFVTGVTPRYFSEDYTFYYVTGGTLTTKRTSFDILNATEAQDGSSEVTISTV